MRYYEYVCIHHTIWINMLTRYTDYYESTNNKRTTKYTTKNTSALWKHNEAKSYCVCVSEDWGSIYIKQI